MFHRSSPSSHVASVCACLLLAACGERAPSPLPGSPATFSVGGTVNGLDGSSVVLRNNGGDDLTLTADGPFTFPTALADGSAYEVTVAAQPASGARGCAVRRGRGTIAGALVDRVAVVCAPNAPVNPQARIARPQNPTAGSCDGLLDYADELAPQQVELIRLTELGGGLAEVELSMRLANRDAGRFRSASAAVDLAENPLGILTDPPPLPADFGPIDPGGLASSTATLELVLRAERVADLLDGLEDGTVPVNVHADEESVYPPGTMVRNWSGFWDERFRAYQMNLAIDPAAPYEPGATYDLVMPDMRLSAPELPADAWPTYEAHGGDGAGELALDATICAGAAGQPKDAPCYSLARGDAPLFLTPGDDVLYGLPRVVHRVRVLTITGITIVVGGDPYVAVLIRVQRTDGERLPDIVKSGSFCAGEEQTVGESVAKTRIHEVDDEPVHPADRDEAGQPIRFNLVPDWAKGLSVSGQLGCSRLKPEVSFRIRDGRVRSGFGLDVGCSIAAELSARTAAEVEEYQEPIEMWGHCFALPPINLGAASIPVTLQLRHSIDVRASAAAGAVAGFSKRWDAGFSFACEAGVGETATCDRPAIRVEPSPFEFTPPQVVEATNFTMQAGTTLKADLRFGFEYLPPFEWTCDLGAGVTLETSAYGKVVATPFADPWWTTTYGVEVVGGVDFGLYGLGLVRVNAELLSIEELVDSGGPLLGAAPARSAGAAARPAGPPLVAGVDQRWSVAIDDIAVPNGVDVTGIAALPGGASLAIAGESVQGRSLVVKLDPRGGYVWAKRLAIGKLARRVRALPDGTAVVGASVGYLARLGGGGEVLWSSDVVVGRPDSPYGRCALRDVVPLEQAPGVYDYVVVGTMGQATNTGSDDGCAYRVRADGEVSWARLYAADGLQQLNGATATRDGGIAVAGEVDGQLGGSRRFPLFGKLDAATGDVRWWRALPVLRIARLHSIAEGTDGTLFGVGVALRNVFQTGSGLLARVDADGGGAQHTLLFQDFAWESVLDFEDWVPTTAGQSAYDEFLDVAPMGDGFVVAGRTGLGVDTAGWVARLDRTFATSWYRVLDGAGLDGLSGVAPAPDGVFVSGFSGSLPEADGPNTGENQLWVTKLPFTGSVEFLPEAGVTTRYLATGLRHSSGDDRVTPGGGSVAVELPAVEGVVLSSAPNPGVFADGTTYCTVLLTRSGSASTLDACQGAP